MRKTSAICLLLAILVLIHPALDALLAYHVAPALDPGPYVIAQRPLTERVVLVVIDSWPARIMDAGNYMPKLFARSRSGATGTLWAPTQTETMQGIMALSTGVPLSGLSAIGLISVSRYKNWTIFDDIQSSGRSVMFSGGPAWAPLFGDRGTGNFRETGHGPLYREDDLAGLSHLAEALHSANPPALSVIHISETDFAAHQFGTTRPEYAAVLRFWDDTLDDFFTRLPASGTTVIVTADHGNDLNGSHGGSDSIYRRVPVLMWGSGIVATNQLEMQAVDMPASIAVLLGVRAPAAALGLPEVDAMRLDADERARARHLAYEEAVLHNPRLAANPPQLAAARATLAHADQLVGTGSGDSADRLLRQSVSELTPSLTPVRSTSLIDWILAAAILGSALALIIGSSRGQQPSIGVGSWQLFAACILVVELLFCARIAFSGAIKQVLRAAPHALVLACTAAAGAVVTTLLFGAGRHRVVPSAWVSAHIVICITGAYLLVTILRPVETFGLFGLSVLLILMSWTNWPQRAWLAVLGCLTAYFCLSEHFLWPLFGERIAPRYWVAAPIAAVAVATISLLQRRYAPSESRGLPALLLAVSLTLILVPAGGLGVAGWHASNGAFWASLLLVLATVGIQYQWQTPWWMWLAPLMVLVFWWLPRALVFDIALFTCCALAGKALWDLRWRPGAGAACLLALGSLLLLLTGASKAISLLLLMGALGAAISFVNSSHARHRKLTFGAWFAMALLLMAGRYAMFDLFGNSDALMIFGLQNLDINSAYTGDPARNIFPAVALSLFKIWLAGAVLLAFLALLPTAREKLGRIAAIAGALMLINVAQMSIYAALAVGPRSDQYGAAAFSIFVHSGLFVFGLLAFLVFNVASVRTSAAAPAEVG